jgi:hypothetical protein
MGCFFSNIPRHWIAGNREALGTMTPEPQIQYLKFAQSPVLQTTPVGSRMKNAEYIHTKYHASCTTRFLPSSVVLLVLLS